MQAAMKIGETIYKAEQESAAKADAEKDGATTDDVIDAEFKDVSKDDKKKS
jgi:molecular chaperone DnaK